MRPNRYSLPALAALLALTLALPAQAQYGTGDVLQVPMATGPITLDGDDNEAAWDNATEVDLTANWDGAWSGHPDPDVLVRGKLLWADGALYIYVEHQDYQPFFWGGPDVPWGGEQILVGVDLTHEGDDQKDPGFGGWPENAPDLGPVAYKVTGADGEGSIGITLNWGGGDDPVAEGYVDGYVFIDDDDFRWGVEMVIYSFNGEIALGNQIGFNIGGASASEEQAAGGDDGAYAYYAVYVCDDPGPDNTCHYAGGNVMSDAASFASLSFVQTVANEPGATAAEGYALRTSGPNPFRGATTLTYTLPRAAEVSLAVFDVLGRQVALLDRGLRAAGDHRVAFEAAALPAGVYTARLTADGTPVATRRVMLAR